jgi:hypothetical protein
VERPSTKRRSTTKNCGHFRSTTGEIRFEVVVRRLQKNRKGVPVSALNRTTVHSLSTKDQQQWVIGRRISKFFALERKRSKKQRGEVTRSWEKLRTKGSESA